jgi:hypothetical protein
MRIETCVLIIVLAVVSPICVAQETRPSAIFDQAFAQYKSLNTLAVEGIIVSDVNTSVSKLHQETTFSIRLKKPDQYLVIWSQQTRGAASAESGAFWNQGAQPYLYRALSNAYCKFDGDQNAFATADGITGGAANTLPPLFLPIYKDAPSPFSTLVNPVLQGSEAVSGDDCYVIDAASLFSKEEKYWISKSSHLIRKHFQSVEPPASNAPANVPAGVITQLTGGTTETYEKVSSPDFKDGDFSFTVPADAALKDSVFN